MGEDTFVEEYQVIHRLILGRRSDLAVHGEVCEKHSIFGSVGKRSVRDRMWWKRTNRTIHSI